ncbi:MAG: branched-chain amino acid ABC transporter permease [Chloroflexi bacterium]|nr:branched-chain amino acid ABC transporter permease [Chloroflexota bacterium]MCI0574730.1 branched-chain amino acid ABC transporter permease [Chloroflexota bacterium]MCI0646299.1 branched-chain amino acid ABC transporter permease [Chloroflexota bacterium]MCI0730303.1 branched-chain amino acid ABC transporter permease [Chloroflexota bacterium]
MPPRLDAAAPRYRSALLILALLLFVLVPYGYAAAAGTAEGELAGLARLHSAAESVYCADGRTTVTTILAVELALVTAAVAAAHLLPTRLSRPLRFLRPDGWHMLVLALLITLPFLIAWQTESSVCSRGRAFFWQSIFVDVFILAILAISYNLIFGFSGVVSFGHAAFFGTGAYTVGLLMAHLAWPWWLAILAALLVGVLIALVKGFVGLRIRGLYFALFTLAFAEVFFVLAGNRILADITGAEDGFTFSVPEWLNITRNRLFFYYLALLALVLAFLLVRRLINSPTGRVLHALRDNEDRAQMLGYNTFHFKLIAIVIAGLLASGAGVLRGLALKGASPNVLSLDFTITPLLMVIIGGMGTFAGPVVGAFGLRLIEQYLRDTVFTIGGVEVNIGERWALILGLIFILSVMLFPQGIVGTWYSKRLNTAAGWKRLFRRLEIRD